MFCRQGYPRTLRLLWVQVPEHPLIKIAGLRSHIEPIGGIPVLSRSRERLNWTYETVWARNTAGDEPVLASLGEATATDGFLSHAAHAPRAADRAG